MGSRRRSRGCSVGRAPSATTASSSCNLAFARASAEESGSAGFGFVGMYVRGARGASRLRERFATFVEQLRDDVRGRVGPVANEDAIALLASERQTDLAEWLEARIERGLASAYVSFSRAGCQVLTHGRDTLIMNLPRRGVLAEPAAMSVRRGGMQRLIGDWMRWQ
jgi:hypothetical protein